MNPVKPTTPLAIGGTTYDLVFEMESVAIAEDLVDRPLLTGLRQKDILTPTISLVRAMLFACLHPNYGDKITYPMAKAMVTRNNMVEIWSAVLNAWTVGLADPDPDEAVDVADPNKDQR